MGIIIVEQAVNRARGNIFAEILDALLSDGDQLLDDVFPLAQEAVIRLMCRTAARIPTPGESIQIPGDPPICDGSWTGTTSQQ